MRVATADLASLQEKYAAISRLRRKEEPDPIAAMRTLSRRHPGALRELDERTMEAIEAKTAELAALQRDPLVPTPAWVTAQVRFHAQVRGALLAKRYVRDHGASSADHFLKWTGDAEAHAWASELRAIDHPPRGRLLDLVFTHLAGELGVDVAEARRLVFG